MKFLDKVPLISYGAYSGREKAAEQVLKPNISAKEKDLLETEYQAVKKSESLKVSGEIFLSVYVASSI